MSQGQQSPLITTPTFEAGSSIGEYYRILHKTIDEMDIKVEGVIKKHEAQFLFAYRNHIKKIKKELAEIKQKSEDQEKMFSSNDRIQYLEKQLTIFRQEALKLYDKLDAKTQEVDILKAKLRETEKEFLEKQRETKDLLKSAKLSEAGKNYYEIKIEELEEISRAKDEEISKLTNKLANSRHISLLNDKGRQSNQKSLKNPSSGRSPLILGRKPVNPIPLFKNTVHDSELKEWFLQCIRTVKREVAQRKSYSNSSPIDLSAISSIDEFRMVDKLRLLELFLQNQKMLVWMYEKIFPDRMAEIKGYLSQKHQKQAGSDQIQPEIDLQIFEADSRPPSNSVLPKVPQAKWKKSEIRNRVSIKNGKLNMSAY